MGEVRENNIHTFPERQTVIGTRTELKKSCGVSKKKKINFEINQKDFKGNVVTGMVLEGLIKFQ